MTTESRVSCTRCAGEGRIANSDDGEPWSWWANLPVQSALAVVMGIIRPIPCPECGGKGYTEAGETKAIQLELGE